MTFGEEMAEVATTLIDEFVDEAKQSTIVYGTSVYDAKTGTNVKTTTTVICPIAYFTHDVGLQKTYNLQKDEVLAVVSGVYIENELLVGAVVTDFNGKQFRLSSFDVDMYKAAYFLVLKSHGV